jgi:hypothetical protein
MAQLVEVTPEALEAAGHPSAARRLRDLQHEEVGAAEEGQADAEVRGVGADVIDLPLPVKLALAEDGEVLDYTILDLTRPGSTNNRIVVLWTGEPPEDIEQARRDFEEWSRRTRALRGEGSGEDDSPPAANDH